jgi:hypothetical protein
MTAAKIADAVTEAKRFLRRFDEWKAKQGRTYEIGTDVFTFDTPRENGALRRSSLDLSRALADMRRAS